MGTRRVGRRADVRRPNRHTDLAAGRPRRGAHLHRRLPVAAGHRPRLVPGRYLSQSVAARFPGGERADRAADCRPPHSRCAEVRSEARTRSRSDHPHVGRRTRRRLPRCGIGDRPVLRGRPHPAGARRLRIRAVVDARLARRDGDGAAGVCLGVRAGDRSGPGSASPKAWPCFSCCSSARRSCSGCGDCSPASNVPVAFVFFPIVGWAGLRFGPRGAADAGGVDFGFAIAIAGCSVGPFADLPIEFMHVAGVLVSRLLARSAACCSRRSWPSATMR